MDADLELAVYTDHQIFERFHKNRLRQGFEKDAALTLRRLKELTPGDFVTHMDHGGDHEANLGGEYSDHDELDERKGKHSARASLNRCQPSLLNICGGQRISAVCNLFGDKRAIFDFFSHL